MTDTPALAARDHPADESAAHRRDRMRWLETDAGIASAAAALGIHRHTLRSRIAQAGTLLDADLSSFPARAELWAALRTAE